MITIKLTAINKSFVSILLLLLLSDSSISQQYNIIHYNRSQDKIGNQVWNIYQDSKGYMWFATSAGLVRYNGWEYEVFDKERGLIESFALNMSEDRNGDIWVGCPSGILRLSFNGEKGENLDIKNITLGKFTDFFRVFVDSYNRVWAYNAVAASDVYLIDNDSLYNFSERFRFKNQRIIHIAEHKDGVYLLSVDGNVYKFFLNNISEVKLPPLAYTIKAKMFLFNQKQEMVLCGEGGVISFRLNHLSDDYHIKWITTVSAMHVIESKFDNYWIATERNGLIKVADGVSLNITEKNGLPTNDLFTLFEDREGILWIGTAIKGIFKLPSLRFSSFGKKEGFQQGAVSSLTLYDGSIYCTTENGIFVFEENAFKRIPLNFDRRYITPPIFLFHMLKISPDEWLVGSSNGLLLLHKSGNLTFLGLGGRWVQTIFKDSFDDIWIGTNRGLFTFNERREISPFNTTFGDICVNAVAETKSGDLYFGTTEGLFILNRSDNNIPEQPIKKITIEDGLLSELIMDVETSEDGEVIIGTAKGINLISGDQILSIDEDLSHPFVVDLFIDNQNNLWVGTNHGLNRLAKKDGKYSIIEKYFEKDGLISNEFTRNNSIKQDSKNRIWFGTFHGLSVYDPIEDHVIDVKPLCYLSKIQINDSITFTLDKADINYSYKENRFRFFFEGLSYFDEKTVMYEYYLEPLEEKWSRSTDIPNTFYGYLNPGNYVFHVRAINQFGVKSEHQSYKFAITPPFWNTWWFTLLVLTFLIILLYTGYLWRTKQIRKRNLLLQQTVDEKTQQLRNSNEKLEIQYKDLLEAQKQLVEKEKLEEAFREIEKLKNRLAVENIYLREKQTTVYEVSSLVGISESIQQIRKQIQEVAPTNSTVLITGETGTGKTLVGEAIHALSERRDRTLVVVNCAAIPDGLVESELFGHEKGAFTGAHMRREGKFEVADGSTIFLDEIGDMDLHIQSKILTFLQDRKFSRLGGNDLISVDVRIIAATNYDLEKLVAEGKFRKDLYHRLQVFNIYVPPLRVRLEDVELLSKFFADRLAKVMNKNITAISKSAFEKLRSYPFPGNVRELENIIQRAIIVCKGGVITDEDIVLSQKNGASPKDEMKSEHPIRTLEQMEREYIQEVLKLTSGKIAGKNGAAELLGLHPNTLRSRMEKLSITNR